MLNKCILTNYWKSLPIVISLRFRVRNLPKEHYGEHETPYFKAKRPGKTFTTDLFAFAHRKDIFSFAFIKNWRKSREFQDIKEDQKFLPERHHILGPNLATAHFICARDGKVKFKGSDTWTTKEDIETGRIPSQYEKGYLIEEIDASNTNLCYEGFDNLCNLVELRKLILQNCPSVDDWCLSKFHLFERTLKYLDLSGCQNITERGICTLHLLKELKTLVLYDTPNLYNKELVSLMLQDVIPDLEIIGVDFDNPTLLKRVEKFMK